MSSASTPLARVFARYGLAAVLATAGIVSVLLDRAASEYAARQGEQASELLSQVYAFRLWRRYETYLASLAVASDEALRLRAEHDQIDAYLRSRDVALDLAGLRIYDASARILYSTERAEIGTRKAGTVNVAVAYGGRTVSMLQRRGNSRLEAEATRGRDVFITFTPLPPRGGGTPVAVLATMRDVSVDLAHLKYFVWQLNASILALLALLYFSLLWMVRRAERATAQAQALVARRDSEIGTVRRRLDLALKGSNVAVWDYDARKDEVYLSESWASFVGAPPGETRTTIRALHSLVHPDDAARVGRKARDALAGTIDEYTDEHRIRTNAGEWRWTMSRVVVNERDGNGAALRATGTNLDITERKRAEEALRASEVQFRTIFERHDAVMLLIDPQSGTIIDANAAALRFYGYSRERLCSMPVWDLNRLGREEVQARMAQAAHDRENVFVFPHRLANGETRQVEVHSSAINYGQRALLFSIVHDVSDRIAAQQALAESEARFRSLTALSSDWYWEQDDEMRFTAFSAGFDRASGTTRERLIGKRRWEEPGRKPLKGTWDEHRAVLESHQPFYDFEVERIGDDGRRHIGSVSGIPVFDADGRFKGYHGVSKDVSARKLAEEALRASEERFRIIFERSTAGIALWGADRICLAANPAYLRFIGYDAQELIGRMRYGDLSLPSDTEARDLMQRVVDGELAHFESDRTFVRKDGEHRWGRVSVAAVRGRDAGLRYVVVIVTDITEAREARASVERLNAELEARVARRTEELRTAVKDLEAFSYTVSHDLRAPLGAINGFTHLLQANEAARLSEDGRKLLDFVASNAAHMIELIEGLLEFSRLGRTAIVRQPVAMAALLEEVLRETRAREAAEVTLQALPACAGDPVLLRQVWANLVGNALKYSRGRAPARIEIGFDAAQQAYFVRDNGVGFDMQYATKLFGVFERLHVDARFEGAGVGLAIADRIVRGHGGRIWARAEPEAGATFYFTTTATTTSEGQT